MRNGIFGSLVLSVTCVLCLYGSTAAAAPEVVADVTLNPAGDFKARINDVKGEAIQEGDTVKASAIVIGLKDLKTGMTLRDKHAKDKYLEVEKFPTVTLVNAIGRGGKGKARIKMRDIEKDVEGTYAIEGGELKADFPIKLSDFKITGIKYMGIGVDDEVKVHVRVPVKKR